MRRTFNALQLGIRNSRREFWLQVNRKWKSITILLLDKTNVTPDNLLRTYEFIFSIIILSDTDNRYFIKEQIHVNGINKLAKFWQRDKGLYVSSKFEVGNALCDDHWCPLV